MGAGAEAYYLSRNGRGGEPKRSGEGYPPNSSACTPGAAG